MPTASVWYENNDMLITLSGLKSSTMTSTQYLNSSTGVTANVWETFSTTSTTNQVMANANMTYVSGTNGNYRVVTQSSAASALVDADFGVAIITVDHAGLDGEWRVRFRVEHRR